VQEGQEAVHKTTSQFWCVVALLAAVGKEAAGACCQGRRLQALEAMVGCTFCCVALYGAVSQQPLSKPTGKAAAEYIINPQLTCSASMPIWGLYTFILITR
jgi:hypothetical protein